MAQGERKLRDFLAGQLLSGETLLACAYGVERLTRAERLGGLMGAWIGGAFVIDGGWGLATTASRLLSVPLQRVRGLLRGPSLRFGSVQSHASTRELAVRIERRASELTLELTLEARPRRLVFVALHGFADNRRQADAIAGWLEARS